MFNFLENEKYKLRDYQPLVNQVNLMETTIENYTDVEIKEEFSKLKRQFLVNQKLSNDIIVKSFALTKEAAFRTIGLKPFDQQLLGGLVLNDGKIAEMKTGEGKTLVATLPTALNAITQKGVHVVTVNDYLAKRDSTWMGQVYQHLGLNVGLVQAEMQANERKKNYLNDITYITNSELAFDYLRDNQVKDINEMVQRKFNYCVIDEVDAILIDEARTPLILSGPISVNYKNYIQANEIAKYLRKNKDFNADEKTTNITFTDLGIQQIEKILGIPNIFQTDASWLFYITNAVRANVFFTKNSEYIVENNQVAIVDEFTGRVMPDRRWNNGLHEAIEAKEGIRIREGSRATASITYQNFFTLYPKLAGMTGTAKTAALELESIYNLEVNVIPTAKSFKREDLPDKVYVNELAKWKGVAKECLEIYKTGRPILVGTSSIEKSEIISFLLNNYNLPHNMLNAKPENLKYESEIVGEAGCRNTITIATNMAGRGTDIILGGSPGFKITRLLKILILTKKLKEKNLGSQLFLIKKLSSDCQSSGKLNFETLTKILNFDDNSDKDLVFLQKKLSILFFYLKINYKIRFKLERNFINELGGLYVIGTERHESRRIDNQLRGRAARQGDAGSSRFFISVDDKIFRVFGGDRISNFVEQFQLTNDETPLESTLLTKSLDNTQERVENYYYELRKNVYDYDEVLTEQRKTFYNYRNAALKTETMGNWVIDLAEYVIFNIIKSLKKSNLRNLNSDQTKLKREFEKFKEIFGFSLPLSLEQIEKVHSIAIFEFLIEQFWVYYDIQKTKAVYSVGNEYYKEYEKTCFLDGLDFAWANHLQRMSEIRESIGWRAYGQKDPLNEYKREGLRAFYLIAEEVRQYLVLIVLNTEFHVT